MTDIESIPRRWQSAGAILWTVFLAACVAGLLLGFMWLVLVWSARPAKAEDGYRWVTQRVAHRSCDWADNCSTYYTYRRVRVREYRAPVYGYVRREREEERRGYDHRDYSPHCLSPVRVVGAEHATEDGAMEDAKRQWAATVRHDSGERYMTLDLARDLGSICDRSSTNESTVGKIVEGVGRRLSGEDSAAYRKRCVIIATPCRAQLVRDNDRGRR